MFKVRRTLSYINITFSNIYFRNVKIYVIPDYISFYIVYFY